MTVWSKLLSALRGGANEVGEAIVDSQALRILDQEIRDADVELRKSREALASIMARHRLAQGASRRARPRSPSTSNTRSRHWRPATRSWPGRSRRRSRPWRTSSRASVPRSRNSPPA